MASRITLTSLFAGLVAITAVAGCGSTTSTSSSSAAASTTSSSSSSSAATTAPTATPASAAISTSACPSTSTVGSALGVTLTSGSAITPGAAATPFPAGASGIGCIYEGGAGTSPVVVVVTLASGLPSSYFSAVEQEEATQSASAGLNWQPVSGLGDQAASYDYTTGTATVEGVLAGKGSSFAGVFTDGTTASLTQIESLVGQLLG